MYDLCIIGGGASGMSAAIAAAQKGLRVIILDRNKKLGKKIYATGNGKCNISNQNMNIKLNYNSDSENYISFLNECLGISPYEQIENFLNSLGVLTYDVNGYIYPQSLQASSVVWAMLDRLNELNVEFDFKQEISEIYKNGTHFVIKCPNGQITALQIVLSCGGRSYETLGGSKIGYELAQSFGHTVNPVRPALCGLVTAEDLTEIAGVRISAEASLIDDKGNTAASEKGELQINNYGLSGIMIFNLSSKAGRLLKNGENVYISVNLIPSLTDDNIKSIYNASSGRTIIGFLNGIINDKLALYFSKRHGIGRKTTIKDLNYNELMNIISELRNFRLMVSDLCDFDSAQVCAGGVSIDEISPYDMMSKKVEGLYITGELLDIDGICGGYNLTFAILSGVRAGIGAYDKNKSN